MESTQLWYGVPGTAFGPCVAPIGEGLIRLTEISGPHLITLRAYLSHVYCSLWGGHEAISSLSSIAERSDAVTEQRYSAVRLRNARAVWNLGYIWLGVGGRLGSGLYRVRVRGSTV